MIPGLENIDSLDRIPISIMRQAREDSGLSFANASAAMGWGRSGDRLKKALGYSEKHRKIATHVPYKDAVKMVRAWNLDPVDYGV